MSKAQPFMKKPQNIMNKLETKKSKMIISATYKTYIEF